MSTGIALVAVFVLAGAQPAEDRWVIASVANVRSAPSADAALAGKLGIGAQVVVGSCAQQFCRITSVRAGITGYIAESLLGRSPPSYPALVDEAVRSLERACALAPDDHSCLAALEGVYRADGDAAAAERVALLIKRKREKASAAAKASGPMLHDVGMHHGEEALAKDGERWFARCEGRFRPVTVSVRRVRDELLDSPEDAPSGREVSVPCQADVLLKGIRGFRPEAVRSAERRDDGSFVLGQQHMAFRSEQGQAVLVDIESGKRQPVGEYDDEGGGGDPHVLFAGDLDGDGALDFIANYSDHYNVSALHLFLSSAAKGWAPKEVYEHRDTGC